MTSEKAWSDRYLLSAKCKSGFDVMTVAILKPTCKNVMDKREKVPHDKDRCINTHPREEHFFFLSDNPDENVSSTFGWVPAAAYTYTLTDSN